jgi:hypothetical protein
VNSSSTSSSSSASPSSPSTPFRSTTLRGRRKRSTRLCDWHGKSCSSWPAKGALTLGLLFTMHLHVTQQALATVQRTRPHPGQPRAPADRGPSRMPRRRSAHSESHLVSPRLRRSTCQSSLMPTQGHAQRLHAVYIARRDGSSGPHGDHRQSWLVRAGCAFRGST